MLRSKAKSPSERKEPPTPKKPPIKEPKKVQKPIGGPPPKRATGDTFYFRAHGRNAKAWWNPKESWERYDYLYSRAEIKKHAERITTAVRTSGVKKAFAFYNNHARANAAANAIMLFQELGVRLKGMPPEAMLENFPDLVKEPKAFT